VCHLSSFLLPFFSSKKKKKKRKRGETENEKYGVYSKKKLEGLKNK
jgi:hypothetical protein